MPRPLDYRQDIANEIQKRLDAGEVLTKEPNDPALPSIYGLFDHDGMLIYIGKANDPFERLKGHVRDSRRRNTPILAWIRKHGAPEVRVLIKNSTDWRKDEKALISSFRAMGFPLRNLADGGDEPLCSHETRVQNGRNSSAYVEAFHADPERKRIWAAKVQIGMSLRRGWLGDRQINLMKQFPHVYGKMLARAGHL